MVMTKHLFRMNTERALGFLGLFLLLLIVRLSDSAFNPQHTLAGRVSGFLARRAIDAVAIVGWLFDRLPAPVQSGDPHPLPNQGMRF
jgi:hypothetical protein